MSFHVIFFCALSVGPCCVFVCRAGIKNIVMRRRHDRNVIKIQQICH